MRVSIVFVLVCVMILALRLPEGLNVMARLNKIFATLRIFITGLIVLSIVACDSDGDALLLSNLVEVADGDFTSVEITGDTSTVIEVGGVTNLSLTAFSESNPLGTTVDTAIWSSSDSGIATVASDGTVTGGSTDGEVDITASFGNLTATRSVRISSAALVSVEINEQSAAINECGAMQFTASGIFEGEEDEPRVLTNLVDWTVSPGTATFVDEEAGLLRVTAGDVLQVTATSVDIDGNSTDIAGTAEVTVLSNLVAIEVEADDGELAVGSPLQYRAFATYEEDASGTAVDEVEITDSVTWSILDTALSGPFASVDNVLPGRGLVTASRAGDGELTASCAGIEQQELITATGSGILASLQIVPLNPERDFPLAVTFTGPEIVEQFFAQALFVDQIGFEDVTDEADWTLEADPGTPFVLDDDGTLTINGIGTAMVTATFIDENNNNAILSDTEQVNVTAQ